MKNKKIKFALLGASLCFALIGCSKDDAVNDVDNNSESGVVSNDEITLTYGSDLLSHYVNKLNSPINLEGINGTGARSGNTIPVYNAPSEVGAINLASSFNGNLDTDNAVYVIDTNVDIINGFNFNGNNITLIIKGNLHGNVNVQNNGTVIVSPTGKIHESSNFHLNSNSTLKNWGNVNYNSGSVDGIIENNNIIRFSNVSQTNLNSTSLVTNNCKMYFTGKLNLDKVLENNSYLELSNGLRINGTAKIELISGSYLKVVGGQISYDGQIENNDNSGFARIDLGLNVTRGNVNGDNRIVGKIDINHTLTIPNGETVTTYLKTNNSVIFNQNTYISPSACTESAGSAPTTGACSIVALDEGARYIGHISSPIVNGLVLSATDVKVVNNYAYVSYHTNDEVYGEIPYGSVRVMKLTGESLSLEAEANFKDCEFNALEVNNNKIYAVGNNLSGGRMFTSPLIGNSFTTNLDAIWSNKLPSLAGKSIAFNGNDLWLAAGRNNGGLFKLTPTSNSYEVTNVVSQIGAKYIVNTNGKQVFFAINNQGHPYIRIADNNGNLIAQNTLETITLSTIDGKNAIAVSENYIYAALSDQGVAKFSLLDGSLVDQFLPSTVKNTNGSKVFNKNGLSNAVTVQGCYVYVANGADGVIILDKNTMKHVAHFNTGLNASTNYVYVSNGYLFVATGRDGLNVIKLN